MREEIKNLSYNKMKDQIAKFKENAFKDALLKFDQEKSLKELFLITRYSPPERSEDENELGKRAEFHTNISLTQIPLNQLAFYTEQFRLLEHDRSVELINVVMDREYGLKLVGSLEFKKEQIELIEKYKKEAVTEEQKSQVKYMLIGLRDTYKYTSQLALSEMKKMSKR